MQEHVQKKLLSNVETPFLTLQAVFKLGNLGVVRVIRMAESTFWLKFIVLAPYISSQQRLKWGIKAPPYVIIQ